MSTKVRSICVCVAQLWIQIHIWVVLFDLNLWSTLNPVPSMYHLSSLLGESTPDLYPAPDPYLGCTFDLNLGSTLALVPSVSHLSSLLGVNSRSIFWLNFLT